MINFFADQVEAYDDVHITSYEGGLEDAKEIVIDLIKRNKFEKDEVQGVFNQMGVACFCNGEKTQECLIGFGENVKFRYADAVQWPEVMSLSEC